MATSFETPPEEGLWGPVDMATAGGRIWVLDHKADRIHRYDSLGGHVGTLSRSGRGPGELFGAMSIGAVGDTLWVYNAGNRRIDFWDAAGNVLGTQPLPRGADGLIDVIAVGPEFVATTALGPRPLIRFDRSLGSDVPAIITFGSELVEPEAELRTRLAGDRSAAIPSIYRLERIDGRIWVYHLYLPLLALFTDEGRLVRIVIYPSDPIEPGDVRVQGGEARSRQIHGAPSTPGGTVGLLRGAEREVYLLTHQSGDRRQRLYVVSEDGDLLGRTETPLDGVLAFAASRGRDRYVAAGLGELEEPAILHLLTSEEGR